MQIGPLIAFYTAEADHQDYATINPHSPYIARFDLPKIANLKAVMPEVYREQPVLVSKLLRGRVEGNTFCVQYLLLSGCVGAEISSIAT